MGADITEINTPIKHHNIVMNLPGTGYVTKEDDVVNTPVIADISGKYDDRFDDTSYYVT